MEKCVCQFLMCLLFSDHDMWVYMYSHCSNVTFCFCFVFKETCKRRQGYWAARMSESTVWMR